LIFNKPKKAGFMKSIKSISLRALMMVALVSAFSCDLDEYNPSNPTADEIWSTPQGFVTVVNAAYSEQRSWYGKDDGLFMSEAGTDLWYNSDKGTFGRQLSQYDGLSPGDGNPNKSAWKFLYQSINICNAGIERINAAGFTTETEKNAREGELRFLRGFYYWHIVETWGGAILRTTEVKTPELTAVRSSVAEFYELIISDLQYAAANLPNEWGTEYGRATKKSALGFLARAYLSRAYYATGSERTDYFTKALGIANEVIQRQGEFKVRLWPDYAEMWLPANNKKFGKADGEALYVVTNSTDANLNYDLQGNRIHSTFITLYTGKPGLVQSLAYGFEGNRRFMPTWALLNFFDEEMDARYGGSFQESWIANNGYTWTATDAATYKKDESVVGKQIRLGIDTALYVTKKIVADKKVKIYNVVDRDSSYDAVTKAIRVGKEFVQLKKYMDPTRVASNSPAGFNDVVVMRLAEMYMIAAEAQFQLGDFAGAADNINVIRTRAAIKTPVDHTADMQIDAADVTLDLILDEKAREFAGEYVRWFDLKRTGKLLTRVNTYNPDITKILYFHDLRPIPRDEIQALLNAKEFLNNPGY
jgi:hypothetical protein